MVRRLVLAMLTMLSALVLVEIPTRPAAADTCSDCGESSTELFFYSNGGGVTTIPYGQPLVMDAIVSDVSGSCDVGDCNTPSGKVYFFDNGATGYFAVSPTDPNDYTPPSTDPRINNLSSFEATVSNLSTGSHSIRAYYHSPIEGLDNPHHFDDSEDTKSIVVSQATSAVSLGTSSATATYGQAVTFTATVTPNPAVAADASKPTGDVSLMDITGGGNRFITKQTINSSGVATFSVNDLPVGSRTLQAVYLGDVNYQLANSSGLSQTITQAGTTTVPSVAPNPSSYGTSLTLSASVTPASATGTVSFSVDGVSKGSASLSAGAASISLSGVAAGAHTLLATYSGDSNYTTSSGTSGFTVNRADTSTVVTSSPNPSVFGQQVTIGATVSPSDATGTVSLYDGTTTIASGPGNVFQLTTSGLSVGSHSLSAHYAGDSNYNASDSDVVTQVVNKADTTTSLSGPASAVDFGGKAKLNVAVGAVAPGAGTPTGTVTFTEGPTVLGSATLSGGAGSLAVADLLPGAHHLVATYGGDENFNGSTSSPITVTVTCRTNQTTPTNGNRVLGTGSTCISADVNGNLSIPQGAIVYISNARIGGDVVGTSASRVALCGVTVVGKLVLTSVVGPVLVGDATNGRCAGNSIMGTAQITSTQKGLKIADNSFGLDLGLNDNQKGTAVENNSIGGRFNCLGNQPAPTDNGRPNQAFSKSGQCARL